MRSTDAPRLFVPRTRTEIAKRAFSVAAPNVWNSLPIDIRNTDCLCTFRNKLKTHFLTASYTRRDIPTAAPLYLVSRRTLWRSTNLILCLCLKRKREITLVMASAKFGLHMTSHRRGVMPFVLFWNFFGHIS